MNDRHPLLIVDAMPNRLLINFESFQKYELVNPFI